MCNSRKRPRLGTVPNALENDVSGPKPAIDQNFEEASSSLADGIKSCRAVVDNYRSMLTEQAPPAQPPEPVEAGSTTVAD